MENAQETIKWKLFTLLNGCVQTNLILSHFCAAMGLESLSTPAKGKIWFLVQDTTSDTHSFNSKKNNNKKCPCLPNILTLLILVKDLLSAGLMKDDATRSTWK